LSALNDLKISFSTSTSKLIEERDAEHKAHQAYLKMKADEAAARDIKYIADLKSVESLHANQMEEV